MPPSCSPASRAPSPTTPLRLPSTAELLTIECDGSDLLKGMLAESDASTFMPRFVVDDELRHGRLAEVAGVDLGLRVRFGAAWLRGRSLGGPGTAFLELLQSHDEARRRPGADGTRPRRGVVTGRRASRAGPPPRRLVSRRVRKACSSTHSATCRPSRAPWMSADRKWRPCTPGHRWCRR